jgi:hypothetical protein
MPIYSRGTDLRPVYECIPLNNRINHQRPVDGHVFDGRTTVGSGDMTEGSEREFLSTGGTASWTIESDVSTQRSDYRIAECGDVSSGTEVGGRSETFQSPHGLPELLIPGDCAGRSGVEDDDVDSSVGCSGGTPNALITPQQQQQQEDVVQSASSDDCSQYTKAAQCFAKTDFEEPLGPPASIKENICQ